MKAIVVYYSHDGNTDFVAKKIADTLGADLLRLEAKKAYPNGKFSKFLWGGKSVIFNEKPELLPYDFLPDEYDTVILGSPVWAGSYTPPIATFLQNHSLSGKKIALFACHGGGGTDRCFLKYQDALPGCAIVAKLSLQNPLAESSKEQVQQAVQRFCDDIAVAQ